MHFQEHVIEVEFKDRPRIAYDILEVFEKHALNKSRLEVVSKQGNFFMVIKTQPSAQFPVRQTIAELYQIPNVMAVHFRDYTYYEEKDRQLQTILNSVSEGIIAIDIFGVIQHINERACHMFSCEQETITEQPASRIFPADLPLFETLKTGCICSNQECRIQIGEQTIHCFISCMPVLDPKNIIIGAVASFKDYQQAVEITAKVNQKRNMPAFENIIHQSASMKQIIETAKVVSHGISTILLRGESGTGKELFARAIHNEGPRSTAPFIAINCGALTDTLLESELFGYEPGAFTGANKQGRKGLFEQANYGTLFLDEVGEVSRQMQVRLLRVLQEQTIRRVGGAKDFPIDVRIIAATNRNLEEMVKQGLFREDLYYRLHVIPLTIPPLRERKEDIALVAQHLIRKICLKLNKPEKYLSQESLAFLRSCDYPGNIRQLENMLELAVNFAKSQEIQRNHFNSEPHLPILTLPNKACASEIKVAIPPDGNWPSLKSMVNDLEKQILLQIMKDAPSSRKAGQILGVSNTTILKKLKKYAFPGGTPEQ